MKDKVSVLVTIYQGRTSILGRLLGTELEKRKSLDFTCDIVQIPRVGEKIIFPFSTALKKKFHGVGITTVEDVVYLAHFGREYAEEAFPSIRVCVRAPRRTFEELNQLHADLSTPGKLRVV